MITDGQEEREFLYAQNCCEALEIVMNNYDEFKSEDKLDITSFSSIKIIDLAKIVQKKFSSMGKKVDIKPVAYIGMVKSTNHRFRVITIFQKQ